MKLQILKDQWTDVKDKYTIKDKSNGVFVVEIDKVDPKGNYRIKEGENVLQGTIQFVTPEEDNVEKRLVKVLTEFIKSVIKKEP